MEFLKSRNLFPFWDQESSVLNDLDNSYTESLYVIRVIHRDGSESTNIPWSTSMGAYSTHWRRMTYIWVNVDHYSTLMVILPMPCWGCRVKPRGMAVPYDAFTHIIPFLFIFSIW